MVALVMSEGTGEGPRGYRIMPVADSIKLVAFLGKTLDQSRVNQAALALPRARLQPGASPTITANKATIAYANRMEFPEILEPDSFTLFLAVRATNADMTLAANRFGGAGWYRGSSSEGAGIWVGGQTTLRASAGYAASNVLTTQSYTTDELQLPRLVCQTVQAGVGTTFEDFTRNNAASVTANAGARTKPTHGFTLGGTTVQNVANGDYYAAVLHATNLTPEQRVTQAASIKKTVLEVYGVAL